MKTKLKNLLTKVTILQNNRPPRNNTTCKLTNKDKMDLCNYHRQGSEAWELAISYNLSESYVHFLIREEPTIGYNNEHR